MKTLSRICRLSRCLSIFSACVIGIFLVASEKAAAETSRNHVWDITFPLEEGTGTYEHGWHLCRDGCERAHRAVDIYATPGTPVYAAADGEIRWRRTSSAGDWSPTTGSGYALYIDEPGGAYRHFYGHFGPDEPGREDEAFAVNPETGAMWAVGDQVRRGQHLGYVGSSGATASGPHLHFELRSLRADLPVDDPGDDAEPGRSYGDPNATIGSFRYLRYDPYPSFQAAEERDDYPEPPETEPTFGEGDYVRVVGVRNELNLRGPEACDDPISGAGRPLGMVGRVIGGPERCPEITSRDMWQIVWSDCQVGWSSEFFLEAASEPDEFCPEYGILIDIEGAGAVALDPDEEAYFEGTAVELEAVGAEGYDFSHWSGSVSGADNPMTVVMNSDLSITAHFLRTYEAWLESQFSAAERESEEFTAASGDPFGTGVINLFSYAFGLNARAPDRSLLPRLERDGDELIFVFNRLADSADLSYHVEVAPALSSWLDLEPEEGQVTIADGPDGETEAVRVTLAPGSGHGRGFVRLRVERGE